MMVSYKIPESTDPRRLLSALDALVGAAEFPKGVHYSCNLQFDGVWEGGSRVGETARYCFDMESQTRATSLVWYIPADYVVWVAVPKTANSPGEADYNEAHGRACRAVHEALPAQFGAHSPEVTLPGGKVVALCELDVTL